MKKPDAQVSSLVADPGEADSEFDFLTDYMKVQRAIGRFDIR